MATPKRGGEIIDINGRMSFDLAVFVGESNDSNGMHSNRLITYSKDEDNRSAAAGFAVTLHNPSGTETAGIKLAGVDDTILGRLESVESDNIATVTISAQVMVYKTTNAVINVGDRLVGDASGSAYGYVKTADPIPNSGGWDNDAQSATRQRAESRAVAVEQKAATAANTTGKVRVMFRG